MKTKLFTALALALMTTTAMGAASASAAAGDGDGDGLESVSGKALHCKAKIRLENGLDQTLEIDTLRVSSASDPKFYSEFKLGGTRYRPVSGAKIQTPDLEVQVPDGHKLAVEVTYRTQKTAGKNGTWSQPKSDKWPASAAQRGCSLAGQTLDFTID